MIKNLRKSDYWFIVALFAIMMFYIFLLFKVPFLEDENFYPTIPLRLINGDSLFQHEWHLTQFSSLFQYLPVKLWLHIKGSSEGIILFLRCCYLLIHTVLTVIIYKFFRKNEYWSIAVALMFYTYLPYAMFALSYASLLVIFLLLFTLSLFSVYEKRTMRIFTFSGFSFGCMCICNPLLCFLFVPYTIMVFMWPHKKKIITAVFAKTNKRKNNYKKSVRNQSKNTNDKAFSIFFTKSAFLYSSLGISAIALIAIVFFFSTGGTLSSVLKNIPHMIKTSEYDVTSMAVSEMFKRQFNSFDKISLHLPFLAPLFFGGVYFDKNRKKESHRLVYLIEAFFISLIYMIGIFLSYDINSFALPFPFTIFSITSYILTNNKNKTLFFTIWCPAALVAIIQLLISNTTLLAFGTVLVVNNIAGLFFVRDLYKEIRTVRNNNKKTESKAKVFRYILLTVVCSQLLYQCCLSSFGKITNTDCVCINEGPYAGLYINVTEKELYSKTLQDIEIIKSVSEEKSPVLIFSDKLWPYIYINRPFATNSAYLTWRIFNESLKLYYEENPDKIPEYIYLSYTYESYYTSYLDELTDIFIFSQQKLSNGILLTVKKYNP